MDNSSFSAGLTPRRLAVAFTIRSHPGGSFVGSALIVLRLVSSEPLSSILAAAILVVVDHDEDGHKDDAKNDAEDEVEYRCEKAIDQPIDEIGRR